MINDKTITGGSVISWYSVLSGLPWIETYSIRFSELPKYIFETDGVYVAW